MKYILSVVAIMFSLCVVAQSDSTSTVSSIPKIQIFLDCQWRCDFEYFRQEMKYVDFMRDRQEAEIFMQLTRQRSANGGNQFTLQIKGQEDAYVGMSDTLFFFTNPEDSDAVVRTAMLDHIQKAMLPFVLKTAWRDKISFSIDAPEGDVEETIDPWDFWVFRLSANGNVNGEQSFSNFNLNSRFNVSRITDESKFFISYSLNNQRSRFDLETESIRTKNNASSLFLLYAKSLSDHWSLGGFAQFRRSDFSNLKSSWALKPALEYSFVPYSENATKEFKILYRIGVVGNEYNELTTFELLEETVIEQNIDIEYKLIKDWGSLEFDIEWDNYARDLKQSSFSFSPGLEWNVFKGFSLDLFASVSYIANRITIPLADLTDEEILLGIRQLDSNFSYFVFMGASYRFGSQINNVVNTRF